MNGLGTRPKDNDELIILRSGSSATGNSFSNLVGTGSNRHVVGLDVVISLFSSSCPIVEKHCSFSLGAVNEAEVTTQHWSSDPDYQPNQKLIYNATLFNSVHYHK